MLNLGKNVIIFWCEPIENAPHLPKNVLTRIHPNGKMSCAECGLKATHVVKYRHVNEQENQIHCDYFIHMGGTSARMMTRDHILPASLGGHNRITNMRAMCSRCNEKRGNVVTPIEAILIAGNLLDHTLPHKKSMVEHVLAIPRPIRGWIDIFRAHPELIKTVSFS